MKIRKFRFLAVLSLATLLMSCGSKDAAKNTAPTEKSEAVVTSAGEQGGENNGEDNPEPGPMDPATEFDSVTELFRQTDPEWNESEEYQKVVKAYTDKLPQLLEPHEKNEGENPRFQVAYIDNDDIPELLISYGSYHVLGVNIYTYDSESGRIAGLGEFGEFGNFSYGHKSGKLRTCYGGQGYFTTYISEKIGCSVVLRDVWIEDGSFVRIEEMQYFHGFPTKDGINGSIDSFEMADDEDLPYETLLQYAVSEEEINSLEENWSGVSKDKIVRVHYDDMYKLKDVK